MFNPTLGLSGSFNMTTYVHCLSHIYVHFDVGWNYSGEVNTNDTAAHKNPLTPVCNVVADSCCRENPTLRIRCPLAHCTLLTSLPVKFRAGINDVRYSTHTGPYPQEKDCTDPDSNRRPQRSDTLPHSDRFQTSETTCCRANPTCSEAKCCRAKANMITNSLKLLA